MAEDSQKNSRIDLEESWIKQITIQSKEIISIEQSAVLNFQRSLTPEQKASLNKQICQGKKHINL